MTSGGSGQVARASVCCCWDRRLFAPAYDVAELCVKHALPVRVCEWRAWQKRKRLQANTNSAGGPRSHRRCGADAAAYQKGWHEQRGSGRNQSGYHELPELRGGRTSQGERYRCKQRRRACRSELCCGPKCSDNTASPAPTREETTACSRTRAAIAGAGRAAAATPPLSCRRRLLLASSVIGPQARVRNSCS